MELPTSMRAWQYTTIINGSLPQSLKLVQSVPLPTPKHDQHLIKIDYVCLNPVDHKPAENPIARRVMVPATATPGIDFAGIVVKPAAGSSFKVGDQVFGVGPSPFSGGCLAEYAVTGTDATVAVPQGLSLENASTIGVAGLTAWQSMVPHNPKRVFINGGSGGTGIFGIQIAKALGMEVAVTCSSRNVDLVKSLGADHVIDYTKENIVNELAKVPKFDLIVDNVMADMSLFYKAHTYTNPGAKYIKVAGEPSLKFMKQSIQMKLPSLLGGGQRSALGILAKSDVGQLSQIADLMVRGKVRPVIDEKFAFEDTIKAFEKLKTQRARGKIVIEVSASS